MTEHAAARDAREALDDLHLDAHENGPTTDMSTHFRRAHRLWNAMGGEHRTAYGDPIPAWDDLGASMQLMLTAGVARAVQDVLEVEQVMYRALSAALALHVVAQPITAAHGTQEGGDYCRTCAEDWPCATFTSITTALEGEPDD